MILVNVIDSSVSFQWSSVECIHRNGEISSYFITYTEHESSITANQTVPASQNGGGSTTISNLEPSLLYIVRIAPVNNQGTGTVTFGFTILTNGRSIAPNDFQSDGVDESFNLNNEYLIILDNSP